MAESVYTHDEVELNGNISGNQECNHHDDDDVNVHHDELSHAKEAAACYLHDLGHGAYKDEICNDAAGDAQNTRPDCVTHIDLSDSDDLDHVGEEEFEDLPMKDLHIKAPDDDIVSNTVEMEERRRTVTSNIILASPCSRGILISGYLEGRKNLEVQGATVVHPNMKIHFQLEKKLFESIVLKLFHAFFNCNKNGSCYIECQQDVVRGFYNATKYMLADNGEIHVTHKMQMIHGVHSDSDDHDADDLAIKDDDGSRSVAGEDDEKYEVIAVNNDLQESSLASGPKEDDKDDAAHAQPVVVNTVVKVDDIRRIRHYNNRQKILLVGEGDFSFASSLATAFCSASNLTATSLDSRDTVITNYSKGKENLVNLEERGAVVIHQVDVHSMNTHPQLRHQLFDRIVYNFPHAGGTYFYVSESDRWYIKLHQQVVRGFFKTARSMLAENGEAHVTHKTAHPFDTWNIVELAEDAGLMLSREVEFSSWNYPGYKNKKAYGSSWDATFRVGNASTFMFCTR